MMATNHTTPAQPVPARAMATDPFVRVVSERRGGLEQVLAVTNSYHGRVGLDLRVFYVDFHGVLKPCPKGIWLHREEVDR